MIIRFIIRMHRILGTALSILFVMWFVSGLVMIYHHYPSVQKEWLCANRSEIIGGSDVVGDRTNNASSSDAHGLFSLDSICSTLPDGQCDSITRVRLYACGDMPLYAIQTVSGSYVFSARDGRELDAIDEDVLTHGASQWGGAQAVLVDTMTDIDVWLIGVGAQGEAHPVYHYDFPDAADGRELYMSSRTGEPLQYTDSDSRFWAWVGPIPHWIYITWLRSSGRGLWIDTVLWLSGIGIVMVLLGIIIGVRSWMIARRRHKALGTPYVKPLFRWHHLGGLCFGLFVLTWIFSGYMSLERVPEWMVPVHTQHDVQSEVHGGFMRCRDYALTDSAILVLNPHAKTITRTAFAAHPVVMVETADTLLLVDGADSLALPFVIDSVMCQRWMSGIVASSHCPAVTVTLMNDYDDYYINLKSPLPLPVYKVEVADEDGSVYYLNPATLDCRYHNANTRLRNWLYKGLHCFSHSWFAHHDVLHQLLLWLFLLGGLVVSLTGLLMGIKVLRK